MKLNETALSTDSKSVLDDVLSGPEPAEAHRHGQPVVPTRRKAGIGAEALIKRLKQVNFTLVEQGELKVAMDAANEVFAHADRR